VRERGDGVGKGGKRKERRGGEYRHFFLYTLSTDSNYKQSPLCVTFKEPNLVSLPSF